MSRSLPLFPLNIVAFPGEKLNLHIFESRYKKLVTDCLEQDAAFGMPSFLNNAVTSYGTKIKVLTVENTYAKGELDIKTQGTRVFRIIEFFRQLPGKPYAGAEVEEVEDIPVAAAHPRKRTATTVAPTPAAHYARYSRNRKAERAD